MSLTSYSIIDAGRTLLNFATQTIAGKAFPGYWNKAVPEGGATPFYSLDAQIAGTVVKASAGQIYGGQVTNNSAAIRYLKFYDKSSAAASTDTPVFVLAIPIGASMPIPALGCGIVFASGIGIRGTTGRADNDNTAPTAGDIVVSLFYA